jgi:acetyltransferase
VKRLIGIAQEKGLEKIYGMVLTDNHKMIRACEELGFSISHHSDGISNVELDLK